jgi:pyruvate-ferredoxin/flavodoxin oxidoreductase
VTDLVTPELVTIDANEAVARVSYALSDVIAIYPITPASAMAELADAQASDGVTNLWGTVPEVVEMQSEAGAAGTLHGATLRGALATTYTASQGLLLMIPNMYKVAGELSPAVIHVAARAVATHALSIFGDHSDVMAARQTGWAMLAAGSVQEAADLAAVAHAATLESRVPFLHFFDGFRTSHEIATIALPSRDDLGALVDDTAVAAHRARGLDPDRPVIRGTAQNPDTFFQAREAANGYHAAVPAIVERVLARFADRTGRSYGLVEYVGAPDANRVVVLMGSAAGAAREAVRELDARGERVGALIVRLFRPFPTDALLAALPTTVESIAVLDRTKEPGAPGEPLLLDVTATLADAAMHDGRGLPRVIGVRYGLGSKEVTPAMIAAVFAELASAKPKRRATVGIHDDVSHTSLEWDDTFDTDRAALRAVFFGLGSDGTVGANKQSAKIVGQRTGLHAQGYFVLDSKKSGSMTVSHLRFDPEPIASTYLIRHAGFVACHQFNLLERVDVLGLAAPGATVLLASPYGEATWSHLPAEVQQQIIERTLDVHVVDAYRVARDSGLAGQINTVMQACFFALTDLLPYDEALAAIEASIRAAYGKRGGPVVDANIAAARAARAALAPLVFDPDAAATACRPPIVPADAPDFVQRVTARMLAGEGDLLPVSAFPVDGTWPTATAQFEKRRLAHEIPIWDPEICIDCGRCALVCPHAAIRMKIYDPDELDDPRTKVGGEALPSKSFRSHDHPGLALTIQVAPDDCTGCGVCVDVCPAKSKSIAKHRAIDMEPYAEHAERERERWQQFLALPGAAGRALDPATVKGAEAREPLFEFSGACAGCGETPYLKLLTQLFGDRLVVANATGCSSIYGGNLPTTPWSVYADGRGPAWANSLFEDNAEFGLGIRLALDQQVDEARRLVRELDGELGHDLIDAVLETDPRHAIADATIAAQRARIDELADRLQLFAHANNDAGRAARRLQSLLPVLVRRSVWVVGGDGWAYDIGAGGLDHLLASGRDINVLVLDTEVYSNTGGQASKSTPRAAVAKFAAAGKRTPKKDLAAEARRYGNVYVAQIAVGANDVQAVKAFQEAEAWPGPSLIIAYSTCIAHGIDMTTSMSHQRDAVRSGYWPLFRYRPAEDEHTHPFQLDSKEPSLPLAEFFAGEARYAMLARAHPDEARHLFALAQADVDERWRYYSQLAGIERSIPHEAGETIDAIDEAAEERSEVDA